MAGYVSPPAGVARYPWSVETSPGNSTEPAEIAGSSGLTVTPDVPTLSGGEPGGGGVLAAAAQACGGRTAVSAPAIRYPRNRRRSTRAFFPISLRITVLRRHWRVCRPSKYASIRRPGSVHPAGRAAETGRSRKRRAAAAL